MSYDFAFQAVLILATGGFLISLWAFLLTVGVWFDARTSSGLFAPEIHWASLFYAVVLGALAMTMRAAL